MSIWIHSRQTRYDGDELSDSAIHLEGKLVQQLQRFAGQKFVNCQHPAAQVGLGERRRGLRAYNDNDNASAGNRLYLLNLVKRKVVVDSHAALRVGVVVQVQQPIVQPMQRRVLLFSKDKSNNVG